MQIAFLTLFLGLVHGTWPVTLSAGAGTSTIELALDGRPAGTVTGPAWTATLDFGSAVLPHHLVARALAKDGGEVGRAEQWVNLPRPPAEVQILPEAAGQGPPTAVRLNWASRTGERPSAVHLRLDDTPLALDAQQRAAITMPAAGAAHVLSAELQFAGGVVARKDVVLTGDWSSDVSTELTAVPIRTRKPAKPLAAKDLAGRLTAEGRALQVAAVEREPPQVFVVRANGVETTVLDKTLVHDYWLRWGGFEDGEIHFHLVASAPLLYRGASTTNVLFATSPDVVLAQQDFESFLRVGRSPVELAGAPQQLADATAVAGLQAYARQTPRAVLLIVGGKAGGKAAGKAGDKAADASQLDAATVRRYLAALGVPLFVWSLDGPNRDNAAWGEVVDVSSSRALRLAYDALQREIRSQQIVWVQGRHLPQSIALARDRDVELVASDAARGDGKRR